MRFRKFVSCALPLVVSALAVGLSGCEKSESTKQTGDSNQAQTASGGNQPKPATQPIIPVAQLDDWCREHAMPESICVQCNASLAAAYKEKGDWDAEHNLPKSQCFKCDPSLKEKFAVAYKAKYGKEPPVGGEDKHDHDHDKK